MSPIMQMQEGRPREDQDRGDHRRDDRAAHATVVGRDPLAHLDGRRVRRTRNVASVVDALLELFHEGTYEPTAQQLADRSGVSLRSVFRYFDDMHDLLVRAFELHLQRVAPLYELAAPPAGASLVERAARVAAYRTRLYYAVAPIVRAAMARQHEVPAVAEIGRQQRAVVQERMVQWFAPELDALAGDERRIVLAALDAALQFEAGEFLTRSMGFSPDEVERTYRTSIERMLGGIGAA